MEEGEQETRPSKLCVYPRADAAVLCNLRSSGCDMRRTALGGAQLSGHLLLAAAHCLLTVGGGHHFCPHESYSAAHHMTWRAISEDTRKINRPHFPSQRKAWACTGQGLPQGLFTGVCLCLDACPHRVERLGAPSFST